MTIKEIYQLVNETKVVHFDNTKTKIKFSFVADGRWDENTAYTINDYIRKFEKKAMAAGLEYTIENRRRLHFPPDTRPEDIQERVDIYITKPKYQKRKKPNKSECCGANS